MVSAGFEIVEHYPKNYKLNSSILRTIEYLYHENYKNKNFTEAINLLEIASYLGDTLSTTRLGVIYQTGNLDV